MNCYYDDNANIECVIVYHDALFVHLIPQCVCMCVHACVSVCVYVCVFLRDSRVSCCVTPHDYWHQPPEKEAPPHPTGLHSFCIINISLSLLPLSGVLFSFSRSVFPLRLGTFVYHSHAVHNTPAHHVWKSCHAPLIDFQWSLYGIGNANTSPVVTLSLLPGVWLSYSTFRMNLISRKWTPVP